MFSFRLYSVGGARYNCSKHIICMGITYVRNMIMVFFLFGKISNLPSSMVLQCTSLYVC